MLSITSKSTSTSTIGRDCTYFPRAGGNLLLPVEHFLADLILGTRTESMTDIRVTFTKQDFRRRPVNSRLDRFDNEMTAKKWVLIEKYIDIIKSDSVRR